MLRVLHACNYHFTTSHLLSSRECLPREENYKIPCRPCNLLRMRMTSLHAVKLVVNSLVNLQLHQPTMVYGTGRMWCSFWRTAEVCHLRFIRITTQRRSEQLGLLLENQLESAGFSGDGTNNDQGFRGPRVPCFYTLTTTTYDTSRSNKKPIE